MAPSPSISPEALFAQGVAALKSRDSARAVQCLEHVRQLLPNQPDVLINLALAYEQLQDFATSETLLRTALQLAPQHADGWANLGNVLKAQKREDDALKAYGAAVGVNPRHRDARLNRVSILIERHQYHDALKDLTELVSLGGGNADVFSQAMLCQLQLAQWNLLPAYRKSLQRALDSGETTNPFRLLCIGMHEHSCEVSERWVAQRYAIPSHVRYPHKTLPSATRGDGILRIGYISSDLHNHATAHLLGDMFAEHDAQQFAVYVYSMGRDDGSAIAKRLRTGMHVWRDVYQQPAETIARQIVEDGIDILVDLKGFTQHHAMGVLALKPAPIQMHYLGYPCTTGADFIDYFIADKITLPHGEETTFSEKILRVPGCYQINDTSRPLPQPISRVETGLPEEGIVFAAFNATYKIQPKMFACWMRLLDAVPGSILWLQSPLAPEAKEQLRKAAAIKNIASERLVFAPYAAQHAHISRLALADIFLDASPVSGHTTASDALWAGIPLITLRGPHFIGRVAASLLTALGMEEWVADDMEAYEAKALMLAQDGNLRNTIKKKLENSRHLPPFDGASTLRGLEDCYRHAAAKFIAF